MEDLLTRLAQTPAALAHLVAEATDALLDEARPGEWSARTILAHFRDDEFLCSRVAVERMLAEVNPAVHFIDGADWEPGRNHSRDRKEHLLAGFALQRQASLAILQMLAPADWERTATRDGRSLTLRQLVQTWVNHDAEHLAQLEHAVGETLAEVKARRARMAE